MKMSYVLSLVTYLLLTAIFASILQNLNVEVLAFSLQK